MPYRRPSSPAPAPVPAEAPAPPPSTADQAGSDPTLRFSPDGLKPNAQTRERLREEDPGSLRTAEQESRARALRTINGLRMVAPALRQSVSQSEDPAKQAEYFLALMEKAKTFATQGCQHLDLDPTQDRNRWAIAMFERLFVTAFADGEVPEGVAPALFGAALAAAEPRGHDNIIPEQLEATALVRQGVIRGMGGVVRAQMNFSFFRPHPDEDLHRLAQLLIDCVERIMAEHVQPLTGEHERQTMMAALLEEGGEVMALAWNAEAAKAREALRGRPKEMMERWRRANPEGLPLEPVENHFRQQMARLSKLMKEPKGRR